MKRLEKNIGYNFQDPVLLDKALRHRSVKGPSNERLEFIGDAILGFVIATELFQRYPGFREGKLSRLRSSLVRKETLAGLAKDFDVGEFLQLGLGEQKSGGFRRDSILADTLEAIVGAIYLDVGISACQEKILHWYNKKYSDWSVVEIKDAKTNLQEYLQAKKSPLPIYEIIEVKGKAHEQVFYVKCSVEGMAFVSEGSGITRQKAEQEAAQKFIVQLKK